MADSPHSKAKSKDMYWFAHGGEPLPEKSQQQRADGDEEVGSPEQHNSPSWKPLQERKALPEEARSALIGKECTAAILDGADNSPLLSHMERDDRVAVAPDSKSYDARMSGCGMRSSKTTEDEKLKKSSEAEQDKNDTKAKRKVDRDATFEARRNAQRGNVSFAFGSSLPRNLDLDVTTVYQGSDLDRNKRRSQVPVSSQKSGPVIAPKTKKEGWAHMHISLFATSESTQSNKMYFWTPVNQPSNCLVGSGAFVADDKMSQSMISPMSASRGRRKTDLTPTIPYDRTAPPRTPVPSASSGKRSVSMTRLDQLARPRRSYVEAQRDHAKANSTSSTSSVHKEIQNSPSRPRSSASEHSAGSNRPSTTPPVNMRARTTSRKPRPVSIAGTMPDRKPNIEFKKDLGVHRTPEKKNEVSVSKRAPAVNKAKSPASKNIYVEKPGQKTPIKHLTPKSSPVRKLPTKARKSAVPPICASAEPTITSVDETLKVSASPPESPTADEDSGLNISESAGKRIISEEEAKAALAEKRRLAREQAEREAELERQHQEELRLQEEEIIRKEEEEQRKMEEEQLRLLEEHRRHEEEKLRKAIEEQERKEHEEKLKREEEARLKAEQERKAKEEAEKQRIELEEKLRKEEEERAERKKRLEKIMSRTRGKGTSSTSSHSCGDQSDSADSQAGEVAEVHSGNSSLNSIQSTDPSSGSASLEIHPESIQGSENESLNSMDMMALSENSSLDSNLLMLPSDGAVSLDSDQASTLSSQNLPCDEKVTTDVKNLGFDLVTSKDMSVEPNMLSNVSADNPSPYSSENETVNTDSTVILSEERITHHPPIVFDTENKSECTADSLLNFGADFVQTLVSQNEDGMYISDMNLPPVSNQLVMENLALNSTSDDIFEKPGSVNSEYFATEQKHDSYTKSECNTILNNSPEISALESEGFVKSDFSSGPFIVPTEMPVEVALCNKHSEVQDVLESTMNLENRRRSEKSNDDDNIDIKTTTPTVPPENIHVNEDSYGHSTEYIETSVTETSKLRKENSLPSPIVSESNLSIPVHSNVNLTGAVFDGNSEQYVKNVDMSHSLNVNPFAGSISVMSDDDCKFPKENASELIEVDDSPDVLTSLKDLEPSAIHSIYSKETLSDEHLIAPLVTDSEDSSLDSNLSQIMNVNIIHNVTSEENSALNGSPLDIATELSSRTAPDLNASSMPFQKMPPYINDNAPTTNGYQSHMVESFAYDSRIDGDCKTSSVTEAHHPVSSLIDNEINSNIVSPINSHHVQNILNSGDINFNKVPSNPFLAADDASDVSENQFINQEEIIRNPFQTESHA